MAELSDFIGGAASQYRIVNPIGNGMVRVGLDAYEKMQVNVAKGAVYSRTINAKAGKKCLFTFSNLHNYNAAFRYLEIDGVVLYNNAVNPIQLHYSGGTGDHPWNQLIKTPFSKIVFTIEALNTSSSYNNFWLGWADLEEV